MNSPIRASHAKNNLLRRVRDVFLKKIDGAARSVADSFLHTFAEHMHPEDWEQREPSDIAGSLYGLWLTLCREDDDPYLRVFNPTLEEDGWLCNGTAIVVHQVDMPFLVDSLRLECNKQGLALHLIKSTLLKVARDEQGGLLNVCSIHAQQKPVPDGTWQQEALIYIEVGLLSERDILRDVAHGLRAVLQDVHRVVDDYQNMLGATRELKANLQLAKNADDVNECCEFLDWLTDSHFTFLGMRTYSLKKSNAKKSSTTPKLEEDVSSRLGVFRALPVDDEREVSGAEFFYSSKEVVAFSKSASRATVHRNVYPDYIVIKRFDKSGAVVGEVRILGLFTYAVYSATPREVPILRRKVEHVIQRSGLSEVSHDGKILRRVIESFPRDELFQSSADELYATLTGVARISERRQVRLFMREDAFGKFINCVVYVPRDIYNTQVRQKIENLIGAAISSTELDSTTHFSESQLARAYMVFKLNGNRASEYVKEELEQAVVELTRGWDDRLEAALVEMHGEALGLKYHRQYSGAFNGSYQESVDARTAVKDIKMFEALTEPRDVAMQLFRPLGSGQDNVRFKVIQLHSPVELSDVIPVLEHLGLRVLGEHPYKIQRADGAEVWLHDFNLQISGSITVDVQAVNKLFEQAFAAIWHGQTESDAFNRLVLGARLNWREVNMLRAYAAYMKQAAFSYSPDYIAETLAGQPEIARNLVALFKTYFEPRISSSAKASERADRISEKILQSLEAIENLSEDKILRRYLDVIRATLRTNFYQSVANQEDKPYLTFKLSPRNIPEVPEPRPKFEIFVYSTRMEGVHLRAASVARGGLRWSDRLQDYRTEVLGLVKAQQVKNAVIVPNGAKGGFVTKTNLSGMNRDEFYAEGVACYKLFIQGLLDLTDNYVEGRIQHPPNVICRDTDDPYLVVAADKGTATFSDIANDISKEYGHWLGDAFASGGSNGYDHKKMGITARGAWISVQRHFREQGLDVQTDLFTVVGIGDMSGDVFGNGMLLSEKIQLIAAFNHQHIFIDPTPDAQASFAERQRLFELPRSGWNDFNTEIISAGGGVYSRSAKTITLSPEARSALGILHEQLSPNDLIRSILKAPVDLLWNGGIGTYVKSHGESHVDVGDKSNDAVRIDGRELRCKVVGEGGNLGLTQCGRIEFALGGGACNTDFIDNSAGVDCSDHEVNIKILLDEMIADGDLTQKQRNQLLRKMTDEVAQLVLDNNDKQTFALSVAQYQSVPRSREYCRFIHFLEASQLLDRQLEYLPSDEEIDERVADGQGLTRPELAVLLSYSKVMLKDAFIQQNLSEIEYLKTRVEGAFPLTLRKRHKTPIYHHRLLNEIVATQLANAFVNVLGITAAQRLMSSTGCSLKEIAVAFAVVSEVFATDEFLQTIGDLNNRVPADVQAEMMTNMMRRLRRGTRWFLLNRHEDLEPASVASLFRDGIIAVNAAAKEALRGESRQIWQSKAERLTELGVPEQWVLQMAMPDNLFSGLCVVEVARSMECSVEHATTVFYHLYDSLDLEWFATQISDVEVDNYWKALARESFLNELELQMRNLVSAVIADTGDADAESQLTQWQQAHRGPITRWKRFIEEMRNSKSGDFAMFSVAIKELVILGNSA